MKSIFGNKPFLHICECCGKQEILTAKEAFEQGWDYPGEGGLFPESAFGVIGPRTCGSCRMSQTLWFALVAEKKPVSELTSKQMESLQRILQEPDVYFIQTESE